MVDFEFCFWNRLFFFREISEIKKKLFVNFIMPKSVNRNKRTQKGSPEGWEQIQPTMDDFTNKMRDGNVPLIFILFYFICLICPSPRVR